MVIQINQWLEIKHLFIGGDILIGNGASISVDNGFTYNSLRQIAKDNGFFHHNAEKLFGYFKTDDFELILRLVWQARNINIALEINDKKTDDAYKQVRDSLIRSVRYSHPEYDKVQEYIPNIVTTYTLHY